MGAWGAGGFENDAALDWVDSVQSVDDVRAPFAQLKRVTDESEAESGLILDSDFASELIAAAETVALLMGRRSHDCPDALVDLFADTPEPDDLLFHQARNAVLHVLRASELAELWEEAADAGQPNEWHASITNLIDRLNPDIEVTPWEPEEIERRADGPAGNCAFCDQPVARESLFGMNIVDYSTITGIRTSLWLHLACLNARLHHKHAIANLKFDPDNLPDLDKL